MLMLDRGRELVDRRSIVWLLVVRDLKVRYSSSALGYVWTILDPLMMSLVYWLVFGLILTRKGTPGQEPYLLFLVVGVLAWNWFNGGVSDTTRALLQESRLVRSTNMPREIWIVKIVLAKGVEFALSIPVIVLFLLVYRHPPTWDTIWALPAAMLLQTLLVTGFGLILAPLTVIVRDLQRVVRILLRVMFYLTPIIYSIDKLSAHKSLEYLMALNPMTGVVDLYRRCIFQAGGAGWHVPVTSVAVTLVILFIGSWTFRRFESAVLKEL